MKTVDNLFEFIKKNKSSLEFKFYKNFKDYVYQQAIDNTESFSTLQYFHQDLNLDENIMIKRKSVLINKLEKMGRVSFFKN